MILITAQLVGVKAAIHFGVRTNIMLSKTKIQAIIPRYGILPKSILATVLLFSLANGAEAIPPRPLLDNSPEWKVESGKWEVGSGKRVLLSWLAVQLVG